MAGITGSRPFLSWHRTTSLKDSFELRMGSGTLAMLMLEGMAVTNAEAEADGLRLKFRAEGIGSQRIRIWDTSEGSEVIATFDHHWSGRAGTLRFVRGGRLEWRREGWWRPTWVFTDRFGNPLVRLRPDGSVVDCVFIDDLTPPIESWSEAVLLLALGWFLLIVGGYAVPPRLASAM